MIMAERNIIEIKKFLVKLSGRLVAKSKDSSGEPILITRGDPMVIAESVMPKDVLGIALYAEATNGAIFSLTGGGTGILCRTFGTITALLHSCDRLKPLKYSTMSRESFVCGGHLFKLFFPCLLLIWSSFLKPYLWLTNLPSRKKRVEQLAKDTAFIRGWMKGTPVSGNPSLREIELLLDHELAGLHPDEQLTHPVWKPIKEQKTRQLFFALSTQMFFSNLFEQCHKNDIPILPIKGVALSLTIYEADPSNRRFGDIDLLVPQEKRSGFAALLDEMGYIPKKKEALRDDYQQVKRKVEFISKNPDLPSLDVHSSFIVKKILARHTEISLQEVFARSRNIETEAGKFSILDVVDEWLYLSYHLVLHHRFSGLKWLKDLQLLTESMNAEQWQTLLNRATSTGLDKTVQATIIMLEQLFTLPDFCRKRPHRKYGLLARIWLAEALHPQNILRRKLGHGGAGLLSKLGAAFWEVLFIDDQQQQKKAIAFMLWPSHSLVKTIFVLVIIAGTYHLGYQSYRANFIYPADSRNPSIASSVRPPLLANRAPAKTSRSGL